MNDRIRVLFVCLGNICRSPLAEGAFRAHVEAAGLGESFEVDSAGTGHWHAGEAPDPRSIDEALRHGVEIGQQRARHFNHDDFARFTHIVVMDENNRRDVLRQAKGPAEETRVTRLLDEVHGGPSDVPDPYYGGPQGFADVWSMVNGATAALLARIRKSRGI